MAAPMAGVTIRASLLFRALIRRSSKVSEIKKNQWQSQTFFLGGGYRVGHLPTPIFNFKITSWAISNTWEILLHLFFNFIHGILVTFVVDDTLENGP